MTDRLSAEAQARYPAIPDLPTVTPSKADLSKAIWGKLKGDKIEEWVSKTYNKIVRWKRNLFMTPSGQAGKQYIEKTAKTINYFNMAENRESVAVTMSIIMPALLLQKPSRNSKTKDHVKFLEKRLEWWKNGDIDLLLREGGAIQKRLVRAKQTPLNPEQVFLQRMQQGKVSSAMRWVGSSATSVLDPKTVIDGDTVIDILKQKHPEAEEVYDDSLILGPKDKVEAVIYENIDAELVMKCAKQLSGAAGPSGLDSDGLKRMICSKQFSSASSSLCEAIAAMARKLCSKVTDPNHLKAYVACRLLPLDKKPGVRPVGIGEVWRRLIGKAIMAVTNNDVIAATAPIQVCAGLSGGVEAAVHAVRKVYDDSSTEAILLVDADNAFNRLNRTAALHNVQQLCPEIAQYIINTYRQPARLIV